VRVAIAGLGSAAVRGHLPAIGRLGLRNAVSLVAAADPDPRRRDEAAVALPGVPLFESATSMLAATACDLLVVAAEPDAHAELIALGLEYDLDVVCEKPLVVTRSQYDRIALAHVQRPRRGIVSVHQYRYSPTWISIARCARVAAFLRAPFSVAVDVQRRQADALAASPWRADVDLFGGMLADHGVHYLALAWTVDQRLDVLAGVRTWSDEGERSGASLRFGSGVLTIEVRTGAPARRTSVTLHAARLTLTWCDGDLEARLGRRVILTRSVEALTDRAHVDSLYDGFYRDLVKNLRHSAWRANRTAEALVVGRTLLELLERTPAPA
jgi:predicted dehydrogenase